MSNRPPRLHDTTGRERTVRQSSSTEPAGAHVAATRRYSVTYAFDGDHRDPSVDPVSFITGTVAEMRVEDIDIGFLGAIQEIGPSGRTREMTVRYSAASKGTIGRLNCRAGLPASGPPQHERAAETGTRDREAAAPGTLTG